jgi:hypothetical protein
MNQRTMRLAVAAFIMFLLYAPGMAPRALAQSCTAGDDIEPATRTALTNSARQYFQMVQQGDVAGLQRSAIPALASNFNGISTAVSDLKLPFATAQPSVRATYELDNNPPAPSPQAFSGPPKQAGGKVEFFCGIYNSPDRVAFVFNDLPAGKYAVVMMDVNTGKTPYLLSLILQQDAGQWKLAGFYPKPLQIAGHDGAWYVTRAREYKRNGQTHNSWFYYQLAYEMWQPFPAMNAPTLDKLYDEMQQVQPNDVPSNGPVQLNAGGKSYKMTALFPAAVGDAVDLVVKYESPDISDTAKTFQDNTNVIKALVAKYPELREGFGGIVARAVAPNGQDYGTLLAMKDIK